jgi:hypothetical protein
MPVIDNPVSPSFPTPLVSPPQLPYAASCANNVTLRWSPEESLLKATILVIAEIRRHATSERLHLYEPHGGKYTPLAYQNIGLSP